MTKTTEQRNLEAALERMRVACVGKPKPSYAAASFEDLFRGFTQTKGQANDK